MAKKTDIDCTPIGYPRRKHSCRESCRCVCSLTALEPDEACPVHGQGEVPPRCCVCGRFMLRKIIAARPDISLCVECGENVPDSGLICEECKMDALND